MGTNRKRLKLSDESKTTELDDRISNLPDHLITHILSFLPTKYAVGTNSLSTFWKDKWTSIPDLDFDDRLLSDTQKKKSSNNVSFLNFVYRVLLLHKGPLVHRFRLQCKHPCSYSASRLNTWISTALSRNVQELDFLLPGAGMKFIPSQLFTQSTLVKLKMDSGVVLKVPSLVCLQRLKVMHLSSIGFEDVVSFYRLFSGCPVLEDLTIHSCTWRSSISVLNITSPRLTSLTIHIPFDDRENKYNVELNTPSLLQLTYFDDDEVHRDCAFKNMDFLVEARLHILGGDDGPNDGIKNITEGICKVQSLYLSGRFLEAVMFAECSLPTFYNLTSLAVGYNNDGAWELLPELLASSPKLKYLVLNDGLFYDFDDDTDGDGKYKWHRPRSVPACLSHHLEAMKVRAFQGHPQELKMIKYILRKAKVLRTLTVESSSMNARDELQVSKELLAFPRRSIACKVMIS